MSNNILDNASILNTKNIIALYLFVTKDIIKNGRDFTKTIIYNNFTYMHVLKYFTVSFFLSYIMFYVVFIWKISGSIDFITLSIRVIITTMMISTFYALPVFLLKRKWLFKDIFLTLLLSFSFIFPLNSLLSIPIFLNMGNFSIDFLLGGGNTHPYFINNTVPFQLYYILVSFSIPFITSILIPIFWLNKILSISKLKLILIIMLMSYPIIHVQLFLASAGLDITKNIDKLISAII